MKNEQINCKFLRKFLQLMTDAESAEGDKDLEGFDEEKYLAEHVITCKTCTDHYNSEKSVIEIVQKKTYKIPIPSDLIDVIQSKITQHVV